MSQPSITERSETDQQNPVSKIESDPIRQKGLGSEIPWTPKRARAIKASMNRIVMISLSSMIVIIIAYLAVRQIIAVGSMEKTIQSDFIKEFQQQDNLFKVEAYLGQWRALELRGQVLVDSLKDRHGSFDFCLDLSVSHPDVINSFKKVICSKGVLISETANFHSLVIGDSVSPLGKVQFSTRKQFGFGAMITPEMLVVLGMSFLFVLLLNRWLVRRLDLRIVQPLLAELAEKAKHETIAKTVQMLAHDIRAPFSSLQTFLKVLQSKPDQNKLTQLVDKLTPEVDKKRQHIESLLSDILEFGSRTSQHLPLESVALNELISAAMDQVFQADSVSSIVFQYDLQNISVAMDRTKIRRVIENILFNAKQAMGFKGIIFITTAIDRFGNAVISIRNSDSFIPPENREQVFDLFFTHGKKRGTGLGLAVAKKIIVEHGGTIRCESSLTSGTSFIINLPGGRLIESSASSTPMSPDSQSIFVQWRQRFATRPSLEESNAKDNHYIRILQQYIRDRNAGKLTLGIVDDEELYVDSLLNVIESDSRLLDLIQLTRVSISQEILPSLIASKFDALIVDVDLGLPFDGNWLTQKIKVSGIKTHICIHSNRSSQDDNRAALSAGADFILPKPMSKSHLLTFLYGLVGNESSTG